MYRVDDAEDRTHFSDRFDHRAEIGLREDEDPVARDAEAPRAHLDLRRRFLAGHVEDGALRRERSGRLHQEGALADARISAEQHARALDDPAAEHAIELADARDHPLLRVRGHVAECDRRSRRAGETAALRRRDDPFLDERVPAVAGRAPADPLGRLEPALLAEERGLRTRGHPTKYRPELDLGDSCAGLAGWSSIPMFCTSPSDGSTSRQWRRPSAGPSPFSRSRYTRAPMPRTRWSTSQSATSGSSGRPRECSP